MAREFLIAEAEAEEQIKRFCDWYGIDWDGNIGLTDEEALRSFETTKADLINAFRRGSLEVQVRDDRKWGDTIVVLQRLIHPINTGDDDITEIVYKEITGATKANIKIPKNANESQAMWITLAAISGHDPVIFRGLRGEDLKVARLYGFLFLII